MKAGPSTSADSTLQRLLFRALFKLLRAAIQLEVPLRHSPCVLHVQPTSSGFTVRFSYAVPVAFKLSAIMRVSGGIEWRLRGPGSEPPTRSYEINNVWLAKAKAHSHTTFRPTGRGVRASFLL